MFDKKGYENMIEKHVLQGSPYEIGYQHGQIGKNEVLHSLQTYEKIFYDSQLINWEKAREKALFHLPAIEQYDYYLIEEMDGVAKGAGVDFEDILVLNARTEILLGTYANGGGMTDGCTVIGTQPPVSGNTIIGQNWDWTSEQAKSLLLLEIHRENSPIITMITEGGIIGKIGFNSAGLGLCFSALLTDRISHEVPIHLALRSVLNASNLSEAIERVKDGKTAASASLLIGQAEENSNGMVVNLEVSPFGIDFTGGEQGYFVHTNHIISEQLLKSLLDTNDLKYESSMLRYMRARQLIQTSIAQNEAISEQTFKTWFADTQNRPRSINMYVNTDAKDPHQMETIFSIIMNLSKRKTYLVIGKPAETKYIQL